MRSRWRRGGTERQSQSTAPPPAQPFMIGYRGWAERRAARPLAVWQRGAGLRRDQTRQRARVPGARRVCGWGGPVFAAGPEKMVLGGCPVSYLLLCGQAALLMGNLLLLHCVSRSHSYNATVEPELLSAGATSPEFSAGASSWEYGDPNSPVILCSYL